MQGGPCSTFEETNQIKNKKTILMNLSTQSREVIAEIGSSLGSMFARGLTPLQILILCEVYYMEGKRPKGGHVFTDDVRHCIDDLLRLRGSFNPTRQSYWGAFQALSKGKQQLLYIAPHKKGTNKRAIALTVNGAALCNYPKSIHPFNSTEKKHEK